MSTTIKDVAKRANVSHSTVSRALRGNPLISDEDIPNVCIKSPEKWVITPVLLHAV